jgi:hypothetical protein
MYFVHHYQTCPASNPGEIRQTRLRRILACMLALLSALVLSPIAPAAHADGGAANLAYVAGSGKGLSVIDVSLKGVSNDISLGGNPSMIYLSLDGSFLFAVQPDLDRVTRLATRTSTVQCTADVAGKPDLVAFDSLLNVLYVAGQQESQITVINGSTCKVEKTIATSSPVYGIAIATTGTNANQLWYSTESAVNVYVAGGSTQTVPVPDGPQYICIPTGTTVYVTTRAGGIMAISLEDLSMTGPIITGGDFGPMDYSAATGQVYAPDKKNKLIDILTPVYFGSKLPTEPAKKISLGVEPASIAITNDGGLAFIALAGGNVAMYDAVADTPIATIDVGGNPQFIITGVYPPTNTTLPKSTTTNNAGLTLVLWLLAAAGVLAIIGCGLLIVLARQNKS